MKKIAPILLLIIAAMFLQECKKAPAIQVFYIDGAFYFNTKLYVS